MEEILSKENITTEKEFSEIREHLMKRELLSFVEMMNIYLKRANCMRSDERIYGNIVEYLLRVSGVKAIWRHRLDRANSKEVQSECVFELSLDGNASEALHTMVSKNDQKLLFPAGHFNEIFVLGLNINSTRHIIDDFEAVVLDKSTGKMSYISRREKD